MAAHCIMSLCAVTWMFFFFCSSLSATPYEKVKLDLYYETLCPDCSDFIVNHLTNIFQNGLIDIVVLKLVPYGNADRDDSGEITCQHGEKECLLNMVEACAIHAWPDVKIHFKFLYCIESWVIHGQNSSQWESCYHNTGLDPKSVTDCRRGPLGKELEARYAEETEGLVPQHTSVPWVVVSGNPLEENYPEFMTSICKAYKGPKPSACNHLLYPIVSEVKKP